MDIKKLKELIEFMKENELIELEVEEEGKKIKLARSLPQKIVSMPSSVNSPAGQENVVSETEPKQKQQNLIEIKTPMVGTFYRAPAPNAQTYVELGSTINPGDIVCIIEAMKLMNEIKSEIKGEITDILAENGEPVEYGQALFLIKPL